jgi:hypothetical protein
LPQTRDERIETKDKWRTHPIFAFNVGALCHQRDNIVGATTRCRIQQLI